MNLDPLSELAIKHKTDKWGKHHYTPVYYELFKNKNTQIKKMLEIGVGEGASLRMWQDFFPNAKIYGAEIDPKRVFKEKRINVLKCDQSSLSDLTNLIGFIGNDLDFVVEDGSHKPEDQIFSCLSLMPYLKKQCLYIIEDVADPAIINKLDQYNCQIKEVGTRYDDRLILVKHK